MYRGSYIVQMANLLQEVLVHGQVHVSRSNASRIEMFTYFLPVKAGGHPSLVTRSLTVRHRPWSGFTDVGYGAATGVAL